VAAGAMAAGTVLLWSRYGRWRFVTRIAGVLLIEALVVAGAGLIVNRADQFYPSWPALAGQTGTAAAAWATDPGRLDRALHGGTLRWRPADLRRWHLVTVPVLTVPPGYATDRRNAFPVVLSLAGGAPIAATGTVTVVAPPSARTTVAALSSLPADLAGDLRVSPSGWAIVAPARKAGFAAQLIRSDPGRYAALALIGSGRPPRMAVPVRMCADPVRADAWAAGQTGAPLAAPVRLPEGRA
jgi:hypothetical protein